MPQEHDDFRLCACWLGFMFYYEDGVHDWEFRCPWGFLYMEATLK